MSLAKKIVVGVDGSEPSLKALRWAGRAAVDKGAELLVVLAWANTPEPLAGAFSSYSVHEHVGSPADRARDRLMAAVTEVLGEDPPVVVQPQVKEGSAAKVLIEAAQDADLLVVGTRGLGGFGGLLLGSVSLHVAAHAGCTVVIVR